MMMEVYDQYYPQRVDLWGWGNTSKLEKLGFISRWTLQTQLDQPALMVRYVIFRSHVAHIVLLYSMPSCLYNKSLRLSAWLTWFRCWYQDHSAGYRRSLRGCPSVIESCCHCRISIQFPESNKCNFITLLSSYLVFGISAKSRQLLTRHIDAQIRPASYFDIGIISTSPAFFRNLGWCHMSTDLLSYHLTILSHRSAWFAATFPHG